jgi:hypothetical protein
LCGGGRSVVVADTFGTMVATRPFGPAGEFAASRHGAFTRTQAAQSGLSDKVIRRLLRDELLVEPAAGVLVVVGSPATWHQQLYVATLASNHAGTAWTRSAAALHRMDEHRAGPLEIAVPNSRRLELPGVATGRATLDPRDVVEIDGIRCTGVARTLCDLAAVEPSTRLKLAFEWAWRTGYSLTWIEQTARRLDRPRHLGPRRVLALVDRSRHHGRATESALEVKVEHVIESLPGVVRQHVITRRSGEFIARVDFAIPRLKIAIEAAASGTSPMTRSTRTATDKANCRAKGGSCGSSPMLNAADPIDCARHYWR